VRRVGVALGVVGLAALGSASAAPAKGWSIQAVAVPHRDSALNAVSCASRNACTAVGYINRGGTLLPLVEHWNGHKWSIQPAPDPAGSSELTGVSCATGNACAAVGYTFPPHRHTQIPLAEWWNGRKWSIQRTPKPAGTDSRFYEVSCKTASACTAVGIGAERTLAERFNGRKWSIQPTPTPAGAAFTRLSSVSCATTTACLAVGDYTHGEPPELLLAERWDGHQWSMQLIPTPANASLNGVSCTTATACTAAGSYTASDGKALILVERWDGQQWSIQPAPQPPGWPNGLYGVSCPTTGTCTAVGNGPGDTTVAERWDANQWSIQPTPKPSGMPVDDFWGVSCPTATTCTAVGEHFSHNGKRLPLAERWNG
jgi:hypothetical protein